MVNEKLSFTEIALLVFLLVLFLLLLGCSSAPKIIAAPVYTPPCGHEIPLEKINKNIREKNECSSCGKIFFYTPVAKSREPEGGVGYGRYGERSYGPSSAYQSDVSYQHFGVRGYSFKENDYGFSERSWYFHDSKVKSYRVVPHWRNTRYHYP